MSIDLQSGIVLVLVFAACGGAERKQLGVSKAPAVAGSDELGADSGELSPEQRPMSADSALMVARVCKQERRSYAFPMFLHRVGWLSGVEDLDRPLERAAVRNLTTVSFEGEVAGNFTVVGLVEGTGGLVATGAFAGRNACARVNSEKEFIDPQCKEVMAECSLAVGFVEDAGGPKARPFGERSPAPSLQAGNACAEAGILRVDLDGDGTVESFAAKQFLDAMWAPSDSVSALPGASKAKATLEECGASFFKNSILLGNDPRNFKALDLLGVLDLDGDGRAELLLSFRYGNSWTWALYGADGRAAQLRLLGESSFPLPKLVERRPKSGQHR